MKSIVKKFKEALKALLEIAPTYQSVMSWKVKKMNWHLFKHSEQFLRAVNVLESYTDFRWE